jgi:hypothetical protein
MATLNIRQARWVGVEFQPDLKHPQTPVRLGLVFEMTEIDGSSVVVIGRMPIKDNRPIEFETTSPITMELAANWVNEIGKETIDDSGDNLFAKLADGWHWNLYLIEPVEVKLTAEDGEPLALAKRLYKEFVGEPFKAARKRPAKKKQRRTKQSKPIAARSSIAHDIPAAWMLKEILDYSRVGGARGV